MAQYTYDEVGRTKAKKLGTETSNYSYNVRSWLAQIEGAKFNQTLVYNQPINGITPTKALYNGNISAMKWKAGNETTERGYKFTYDNLSRLTDANYGEGANIDNEYVYDANGNLIKDLNKNITSITYNYLNLPNVITFADGNSITYDYDANGSKLSVAYKIGDNIAKTEYVGNKVYKNGTLSMILTEEGYITVTGTTPEYYYYLKDHQGNNRVVINQSSTVEQVNHYYPFGGLFGEGMQSSNQPYKYNGKEFDNLLGLNMYDYGARHYDPYSGRWINVDPLAEKYYSISPYVYVANNPVRFIDPDGREIRVAQNEDGTFRVIGGILNKDRNIYVYTQDKDGNYTIRGSSIGITTSTTSFYNADANDGEGAWASGSIINLNDKSGENFLGKIFGNTPAMIDDYMANAGNGGKYDFKVTNGTDKPIPGIDTYRGMPIGETRNGQTVFSSARDIGNIAAGYVAGANGMSWEASRIAFDAYQSKVNGRPSIESISTRNAEHYGWRIGSNINNNTPVQKANNLLRSVFHWITK